ncbi:MAG: TAXI family TRAP transporter solute-binding subunit [Caldimonas sp.]
MRDNLRVTLLSLRDLLATALPFALLAFALLGLAYWLLDPAPPKRVVLATGQDQGAYAEFGRRYVQILRENGIEVRLRPTAGAAENIALLRQPDGDVDIAFVQGGAEEDRPPAGDETEGDGLVSLGSLFYEPVWLFYRGDSAQRLLGTAELTSLAQLAGWRLNIGAPGSGVPNLMGRLIDANHMDRSAITLVREAQTPAVVGLLDGRIDALVFASAPESLLVQMLLQTPDIRLFDFAQAEAYARRFPFLAPVTLPRGVVDLARDVPPGDVRLIAPTASLVARKRTHPALIQLFVQAAQQVHGGAGWFQKKGDFPNAGHDERPLAGEAQRFYTSGPPLLQRYLPFWLANLVDRMWPAILTIVAALLPLSRVLPPLYTFRVRSRVFRWYRQLREVENAIGRRPNIELLRELEAIEKRVEQVTVPLSYADELYSLRTHIHMVAERLVEPLPAPGAP